MENVVGAAERHASQGGKRTWKKGGRQQERTQEEMQETVGQEELRKKRPYVAK